MTHAHGVDGIVLAAGSGTRFGGQKLLTPLAGRPLLQHVVDAANASSLGRVVVVLGHEAEAVHAAVSLGRATTVTNRDHASGVASSLRAGVAALGDDARAAVVILGDVPGITATLIDTLVARQRATGAPAVLSRWSGRPMPPALLARELWPAVSSLRGDAGMREILAGRDDVVFVDVTPQLGSLADVDTPADHARLTRQ